MARPQKEGLDYFPHDVYASSDEKIEPLILLYGAKGYAFYFLHLEYIYRNKDLEFDISDAETREVIQQKLHISAGEYEQILQTALKKRCFDREYYDQVNKLTSNGIKKRASSVLEKRDKMRNSYDQSKKESSKERININKSKVKEKNWSVSSPISEAETVQKHKKDKYITCQHLSLTKEEYEKLVTEYGEDVVKDKLSYAENYTKLKNYKSLYLTLANWLKKDNKATPIQQDARRIVRSAEDVSRLGK